MKAYVHSFESLAGVDGEGLRYAVFLSGCPLRCVYCHNPDTQRSGGGMEIEASELAKKVARYTTYFKNGGGVTFSGGEPLCQADFINECGEYLRNINVGYVLDTSGAMPLTESVKRALSASDGVILDIKFPDSDSYKRYTGVGIENTLKTLGYLESIGKKTLIRTVIVPGINDTEDCIKKYAALVKPYKCVKSYELLGFHTMGFFKYKELGIENPLENTLPLSEEKRLALQKKLDGLLHSSNN